MSRAKSDPEINRRLKCVHQDLLAERGRATANAESAQRVEGLMEEVREVIMDYQVCVSCYPFLLCLTFMLDFTSTRYL